MISLSARRLVILGHTGFVGRRVQEYFAQRYPGLEVVGLSSQEIDLTKPDQAARLAEHLDADTDVIMCSGIKSNYGSNLETYGRNLAMAQNVCGVLSKNSVRRFVFFSSIAVYGVDKHDVDITEQTPVMPDTHYGLAKYHSEGLFSLEFDQMKQSSLVIVRTPTIYGPNEKIIAPTPSGFLTTYLDGGQVNVWGDGSELREFLFIEDLVRLLDELLQGSFSGVLNVSSGHGRSYQDAIDVIARLLNRDLVVNRRQRTKPKVDKVYNTALLQRLLPGFRFTPLEEGLTHMIASRSRV
jgi:UDP-glucose 4-epimerase